MKRSLFYYDKHEEGNNEMTLKGLRRGSYSGNASNDTLGVDKRKVLIYVLILIVPGYVR